MQIGTLGQKEEDVGGRPEGETMTSEDWDNIEESIRGGDCETGVMLIQALKSKVWRSVVPKRPAKFGFVIGEKPKYDPKNNLGHTSAGDGKFRGDCQYCGAPGHNAPVPCGWRCPSC